MIENNEQGIFWPQNAEYSNTSELVKMIASANDKKVHLVKGFAWLLKIFGLFISKIGKAFGNLSYEQSLSEYKCDYRRFSLQESIRETEVVL